MSETPETLEAEIEVLHAQLTAYSHDLEGQVAQTTADNDDLKQQLAHRASVVLQHPKEQTTPSAWPLQPLKR